MPGSALQRAAVLERHLAGDLVLIDQDRRTVCVLNPSARGVWELCEGRDLDGLVSAVAGRFAVDEEVVRAGCRETLDELSRAGMLREAGP